MSTKSCVILFRVQSAWKKVNLSPYNVLPNTFRQRTNRNNNYYTLRFYTCFNKYPVYPVAIFSKKFGHFSYPTVQLRDLANFSFSSFPIRFFVTKLNILGFIILSPIYSNLIWINKVIKFNFFFNIFMFNYINNNWQFYNKMNYLWIFNHFIN